MLRRLDALLGAAQRAEAEALARAWRAAGSAPP
jgi:hypothetical protein